MFELSVACKYLTPRRRQLSVSIISLISIFVISLVVWLIVVFFSVTDGLEKNWVQKLTALTAPVRVTPTDAYYHSYYYLVDSISDASNYSTKTIAEKNQSALTDPYDLELDQEIPTFWTPPDLDDTGSLKDLVKLAYQSFDKIEGVHDLQVQDFELTATHIQLHLLRQFGQKGYVYGGSTETTLSYPAYLGNFETNNTSLKKIILPLSEEDLNQFLYILDKNMSIDHKFEKFFDKVNIKELKSRPSGWNIPRYLLPKQTEFKVSTLYKNGKIFRILVVQDTKELGSLIKEMDEQGIDARKGTILIDENKIFLKEEHKEIKELSIPITLVGNVSFKAQLDLKSLPLAKGIEHLRFDVEIPLQNNLLKGNIPYRGLEIAQATIQNSNTESFWVYQEGGNRFFLPQDFGMGEAVILPKSFKDVGVLMGDSGTLSYLAPTASMLQEQKIEIYVAGFYDPGIIPIGGKFILADRKVTSLIKSSHNQEDKSALTNGINIRFNEIEKADLVKNQIIQQLKQQGISHYWNVETYKEYEFTKEIIHELQSQKYLFMLIAVVIILVACSNIISMLVILVNDKKPEIGILRSMGASSTSIACIFGLSGGMIGVFGSVLGIAAAILTLHYLDALVAFLSQLQGQELFNAHFYGQMLPSELSIEALTFVVISTVCLSLLAGLVPAIKASLLKPSEILRSGG